MAEFAVLISARCIYYISH